MGWGDPVVGGVALRRAAIQSPNYVAGSAGWTINQDGSVEFNNGTFRGTVTAGTFQGTNFIINSSGEFFYSSTPAAGNLVASISNNPGTDAFGNAYPAGYTTYDRLNNLFVNAQSGVISLGQIVAGAANTTNAAHVLGGAGELSLSSVVTAGLPDACDLVLFSGSASQPTGAAGPTVQLLDAAGSSAADFTTSGSVYKTNNTGVAYSWQTPSMSTGYTNLSLRYKLDAEDNLVIDGGLSQTTGVAGAGSAQVITALIAPYKSTRQSRIPMSWTSSTGVLKGSGMLVVQTTGEWDVQWPATTANGDRFYCTYAKAPLGNLA